MRFAIAPYAGATAAPISRRYLLSSPCHWNLLVGVARFTGHMTHEEVSMIDIPRNPAFYLVLICGLAVIVGVLAFAMSGGRLPGTVNSPSADVSGKTAQ